MKLIGMQLKNFKGVREYAFSTNGMSVNVFGNNATGKTTLFDAFCWILFGKDSLNRSEFGIKTLDKEGKEIPHIEHEVHVKLLLDNGDAVELRRVFKEKWSRKRGAAEETFSGHTTDYYIDGVPVKEKEYSKFISELMDDKAFKLLTNPLYFNEVMRWDERRNLLIKTFGGITDEAVLESDDRFKALLNGRRDIEDYNKVVIARKREINKLIDEITVRIDEATQSATSMDPIDTAILANELQAAKEAEATLTLEMQEYKRQSPQQVKQKALKELHGEYADAERAFLSKKMIVVNKLNDSYLEQLSLVTKTKEKYDEKLKQYNLSECRIEDLEKLKQKLVDEWNEYPKKYEGDSVCPTCGQDLPAEQVERAIELFNLNRSRKLAKLNEIGKNCNDEIASLQEKLANIEVEIEQLVSERDSYKIACDVAQSNLKEAQDNKFEDTDEAKSLIVKIETLSKEVSDASAVSVDDELIGRLKMATLKREQLEKDYGAAEATNMALKRVAELAQKQSDLVSEYDGLEKQSYLLEEFTRAKVTMLERVINRNFKHAKFKMFNHLVNGGIEETCEVMYDNVPYTALNNAAKINIGLDVINAFTKALGVSAPIFIDNAEAVVNFLETDSQLILLTVSSNDNELRIEQYITGVSEEE